MPKIISAFSGPSPIAKAIAQFGQHMWGDKTANKLKSEKLYALERANTELNNFSDYAANNGGVQSIAKSPVAQAMLIRSGYDPRKAGAIGLMGAANQYGATDPRTQNWQIGTGEGYGNTADAVDASLAETRRANDLASADRRYGVDQGVGERRYEFENAPKPALAASGQPTFAPQSDLAGGSYSPILTDTERKGTLAGQNFDNLDSLTPAQKQYLGAAASAGSHTPRNYIVPDPVTGRPATYLTADGVTDLQTGKPLPSGGYIGNVQGSASDTGVTSSVKSDLQGQTIANKKFNYLIDQGLALTQDPTLFGAQGKVRSLAQEAGAGLAGLSAVFGKGTVGERLIDEARAGAQANGLAQSLPELFGKYDPNLPKVDTIWGLLVYQGAAALANQEGRAISDKDVEKMKAILGDPQSFFSSAQMMRSKLRTAQDIVANFDAISREALGRTAPVAPAPSEAPPPTVAQPLSQADVASTLQSARDAIAKGAPRAAVVERLKAAGIDPEGL